MAELQKRDYKREKLIVQLYNMGYTYGKIAKKLGITKVRVGQIYRRTVRELRNLKKVVNE